MGSACHGNSTFFALEALLQKDVFLKKNFFSIFKSNLPPEDDVIAKI